MENNRRRIILEIRKCGAEPIKALVLFDSLNLIGSGGDYEYGSGIVTTTNSEYYGITVHLKHLELPPRLISGREQRAGHHLDMQS